MFPGSEWTERALKLKEAEDPPEEDKGGPETTEVGSEGDESRSDQKF